MNQKWILVFVILVFYHEMSQGTVQDRVVMEGSSVEIKCRPEKGTLVIWLRVLDQSGVEHIESFSPSGMSKNTVTNSEKYFSHKKSSGDDEYTLTLKSYKSKDSGLYTCCTLNSNKLQFGAITRLYTHVEKEPTRAPTRAPTPLCTSRPTEPTTTTSCACKKMTSSGQYDSFMICSPYVLGPLAGGCGFFLVLLIVISVYCNKIRTRRCPHHYKRKPRMRGPEKMMTNI